MIRIGTRGSDLALWQARHVAERLAAAGAESTLVVLETRGDRIDDVPLQSVEGKGFFTSEIEAALREKRIDLAVHSHKDLPSAPAPGLVIAAVPARASVEERLLIAPAAHAPRAHGLPLVRRARVGTSAPRRTEQLRALRADLELLPLRGNVPTRVRRLREGRYDAIVLAAAGLDRLALDLRDLIVLTLPRELLVPAPGQGALAIQTRADDEELRELCARVLADRETAVAVEAERQLLVTLGGGCNLPLGVALERGTGGWSAFAFLGADHPRPGAPPRWCRTSGRDPAQAARALGERLLRGEPTGQGPLEGLTVAVTGSRHSCEDLVARLTSLGATVVREEVLTLEDLPAPELEAQLASLRPLDVLAVTSASAARRLARRALPKDVRIAAVGEATARALAAGGLRADVVGASGAAELARGLQLAPGARVLFPCAETTLGEFEREFAARGTTVVRVPVYRTRPRSAVFLDPSASVRLYTSPSAVEAALAWERSHAPRARRVALGGSTGTALERAGLPHTRSTTTAGEDVLAALFEGWTPRPRAER